MTDARQRSLWHRTGELAAVGALLVAAAPAEGCGGGDDPSGETGTTTTTTAASTTAASTGGAGGSTTGGAGGQGGEGGSGTGGTGTGGSGGAGGTGGAGGGAPSPLSIEEAANAVDVSSPFDATPDPEGQVVFFTAIGGSGAGVFRAGIASGPVTEVAAGAPFVAPFAIATSTDGKQLFVADPASETETGDAGNVFVVSATGVAGAPQPLAGAEGYEARGLETVKEGEADQVYFTGTSPEGVPGVFKVPAAGGNVVAVATGDPLEDPSGIAIAPNGDIYVANTSALGGLGSIVRVKNGAGEVFVGDLRVGYPFGIALTADGSTLLVSGLSPETLTDVIWLIDTTSKEVTAASKGIDEYVEAAGMHRAKNVDVFAWADGRAQGSAKGSGTVFVLKK